LPRTPKPQAILTLAAMSLLAREPEAHDGVELLAAVCWPSQNWPEAA
jgi:hypothetical protein